MAKFKTPVNNWVNQSAKCPNTKKNNICDGDGELIKPPNLRPKSGKGTWGGGVGTPSDK